VTEEAGLPPEAIEVSAESILPPGKNLGFSPPRGFEPPRRGMFSSLSHRDFRLYWTGMFFSNVGTWMQTVAQGWLVLQLTNSPLYLGLDGFAASIPTILTGPFAGVMADRLDRRRLLLVTQTGQMLCALGLALLVSFHAVTVAWVITLSFLNGLARAITIPSHQSLFLDLVGREDLMNAIALNSSQFNLSRLLGPTAAGFAIAALGEAGCFYLNAASFAAILAALLMIRVPKRRQGAHRGYWVDLRLGLRFAFRHPAFPQLLTLAAVISLCGIPVIMLLPVFARDLLRVGARGLGTLYGAIGLGALASALGLAALGDFPNKDKAVFGGAALFAVSLAGFAFSRSYLLSLGALALVGAAMVTSSAVVNTLLQQMSPDRFRGRILSLYALAWLGLVPFGNLLAGAAADRYGASKTLASGAVLILVSILLLLSLAPLPQPADLQSGSR